VQQPEHTIAFHIADDNAEALEAAGAQFHLHPSTGPAPEDARWSLAEVVHHSAAPRQIRQVRITQIALNRIELD